MNQTTAAPFAPRPLSVLQVNKMVKGALEQVLPPRFWVTGELMGYDRNKHRQHLYFDLVDKDPDTEKIAARLGAVIFAGRKIPLFNKLQQARAGELTDGVRVCLMGHLDMYLPSGQIQLIVEDIDPTFTLGDLLRQRRILLEKLTAEGLLNRNKAVPLSRLPLKVGLISSVGSAAYEDFTGTLLRCGYPFRVLAVDARMQGADTQRDVTAALRRLGQPDLGLAAIVICRGGGGQADLSWFDHEAIARAITACPLPVITGIGHTTDQSVADQVAFHAAVTPTDAAGFLAGRAADFDQWLTEKSHGLQRFALMTMKNAQEQQAQNTRRLALRTLQVLREHENHLPDLNRRLHLTTSHGLQRRQNTLHRASQQIASLASQKMLLKNDFLQRTPEHLNRATHRFLLKEKEWLPASGLFLKTQQQLKHRRVTLSHLAQLVAAHDPQKRLGQGYALLHDKKGRLLKTRRDLQSTPLVVATVSDGTVTLRPENRAGLFDEEP